MERNRAECADGMEHKWLPDACVGDSALLTLLTAVASQHTERKDCFLTLRHHWDNPESVPAVIFSHLKSFLAHPSQHLRLPLGTSYVVGRGMGLFHGLRNMSADSSSARSDNTCPFLSLILTLLQSYVHFRSTNRWRHGLVLPSLCHKKHLPSCCSV